ncbi:MULTISPECIES: hypothetical protein [Prauserella salsuginis group]|uniref:Lipoprotein n=1 Tax=Prauserella salsuginis TaxID=387889 RepID=A0ABW6G7Y9_9PSEU|nr:MULTISPECIES: hypothetical protein [Prauserella salsuginis group]MCR3719677.1 hypothetical protein [Prauserella flava]MCR3735310.1 hypothetical protein [Prauserella salsuginis]
MNKIRTASLTVAALAFTAMLAGCGATDDGATSAGGTAETNQAETTNAPPNGAAPETGTPSRNGNPGSLTVESTGDGPFGLTTQGRPDGRAEARAGKLVVGPGSCLALESGGRPELLIFGDDAEFVLRGGRPSATTAEAGTTAVGERLDVSATSVAADDVTGIPQQCTRGSTRNVLVVD